MYDPGEGFSVNFDMVTDIPEKLVNVRINFGVSKKNNPHNFTYLMTGEYSCE